MRTFAGVNHKELGLYLSLVKTDEELREMGLHDAFPKRNDGAQLSETKPQSDKDSAISDHAAVSVEDDESSGFSKVGDYLKIIQSLRSTLQYFQDLLKDKDELIKCQRNIINTMRINHTNNENTTSRNVCIEGSSSTFPP